MEDHAPKHTPCWIVLLALLGLISVPVALVTVWDLSSQFAHIASRLDVLESVTPGLSRAAVETRLGPGVEGPSDQVTALLASPGEYRYLSYGSLGKTGRDVVVLFDRDEDRVVGVLWPHARVDVGTRGRTPTTAPAPTIR